MPTITKRDIVQQLASRTGLTQQQVFDVVQGMLDEITTRLANGDQIVMRNFGTFHLRRTKPRVGRNPSRPENNVNIPERTIVRFKPGKELQGKVLEVVPSGE
ncbi:MAG: HU family DNA-binding protein [Verrucomicrobia bacterium]|nr:HU family DNA-binding protein [Verrucomicrobiota bacterium]